jgi:hypothetical protein
LFFERIILKLNLEQHTLEKLRTMTGTNLYSFLGFTLHLETADITDNLAQPDTKLSDWANLVLSTLITHYSTAKIAELSGKLVKFKDLPGGCAYEDAFIRRAIQPIADTFGERPIELAQAVSRLGGKALTHGDASAEIMTLKGIPLTYIVWGKEEYPAAATILYDESASGYLPTEDLAVLGEFTTIRIVDAKRLG